MAQKPQIQAYKNYSEKLVKCLPMDDTLFTVSLSKRQLLPGNTSDKIETLSTQADKALYFLNHVIKPALDIDDTSSFDDLISVMEHCGYTHVKKLACEIKSEIDKASHVGPGKRTRKISSDDDDSISLKNQYSNGEEDYVPLKKHRKASKQENIPIAYNLEDYEKKFTEDNVEDSFVYMLHILEKLWSNVEFSILKSACKRDGRLSNELKNSLASTNTLGEIFDILSNTPFCNWLDIRILKSMGTVADIPEATQVISTFENCVYSRKCSEVIKHFRKQFINPDHLTKVIAKFNKHADCLVVAKLIKYCQMLESVLQVPSESNTLVDSEIGCLKVSFVIPKYCYLHAYEILKRRFLKLRPFNIQYLQIGDFPKLYTTNLIKITEAKSLLAEIAPYDNWLNPLQVINHYYTYLEGHMDADSVSHMMHSEHLITDSDYEAITAAPNDINMNCLLLQYVRTMDMPGLLKFCDLLKNIETQQCIGDTLESSLKSANDNETARSQRQHTLIPSKPMNNQFRDVNTIFLEVIDKLVAQLHALDVEFLADKCHTLMASDIHNIKLFTDSFIKKLFKCSNSSLLFKIFLLPFNTWLDNTILGELLATAYENIDTLKVFYKFIHYAQPITSYPIPTFSQLIIPLDESEHTLVAIKTVQNCKELILKDITNIKEFLKLYWELTAHALQLVAIDYFYNFMYWMIPKQVKSLVENKLNQGQHKLNQRKHELNQGQHELWNRGIVQVVLLPNNFFSANDSNQQVINDPFNISSNLLMDSIKLDDADKTVALQDDSDAMLKYESSWHKVDQQAAISEEETRVHKHQGDAKIQKELDIMRIRCNELEEEKDDLISRKSIVEKNYKILQVKHRKITEKYATLRSQMSSNTTDVTYSETGTKDSHTRVDECEGHKKENKGLEIEGTEPIKTVIEKEGHKKGNEGLEIEETPIEGTEPIKTVIEKDYLLGDKPERVTMTRMEVYKSYVEQLLRSLPMDDSVFIHMLSTHKLLPGDTNDQLEALQIQHDKALYFLNHVINEIGHTSSFDRLLSVMEQCGYANVEKLAGKMKSEIDKTSDIYEQASASDEKESSDDEDYNEADDMKDSQDPAGADASGDGAKARQSRSEKKAEEEYHDPSESDQYHFIEQISSGATGTVYKAKDVVKGKLVAIKQLRYDNSEGTPYFVMREISDLQRLSGSPHIVSLLDVFPEPAKSFLCKGNNEIMLNLVFEYVAQDLAQHIEASHSITVFSEAYIKDLMEQLLKGVEAIHNNNIIHRDLKPSNILVSPDGKLKISDFGLSRPFHTGKILSTQVVTICYRAPELLLSSGSYSFAVDMWSVGCIFAELYLKCPLFQATNEINMLKKIFSVIGTPSLEEWPTSVHIDLNSFEKLKPMELVELLPGASSEACSLISKLLRFKDSQRLSVDDALKDEYFQ